MTQCVATPQNFSECLSLFDLFRSLVQGQESRTSLGQDPNSNFADENDWDQGDDGGDNDFSLIGDGDDFEQQLRPGVKKNNKRFFLFDFFCCQLLFLLVYFVFL